MVAIFAAQGDVASAHDLMAVGVSPDEISRLVARKEILRVRQGVLILASALQGSTPWERRAFITRAVGRNLASAVATQDAEAARTDGDPTAEERNTAGAHALSHESALIVHGLPYLDDGGLVHLSRVDGGRGRRDSTIFVHKPIDETWVQAVDGLQVVSAEMAALQSAAHSGVESGLVCLDGVLHRAEAQDKEEFGRRDGPARALVQGEIDRAVKQGFPRADGVVREVVELADGGSESVGESRTRWLLHTLGFGPFITQFPVRVGSLLLGRADLKLRDWDVIIEFDGQGKYVDGALYAEKRREDQFRDLGYEVVRITWDDLAHPARVRQRVLSAIARVEAKARLGA